MPKIAQDIIYWSCVVRRWCIVRAAGHNNIYVAMETSSSKTVWFGSKCADSFLKIYLQQHISCDQEISVSMEGETKSKYSLFIRSIPYSALELARTLT